MNPILASQAASRLDLYQRLRWRYGDALARMKSAAWVADLAAWHRLGR